MTPTGLTLQLEPDAAYPTGDNLSVQEVNGGSTASDLGIFDTARASATGPLVGQTAHRDRHADHAAERVCSARRPRRIFTSA